LHVFMNCTLKKKRSVVLFREGPEKKSLIETGSGSPVVEEQTKKGALLDLVLTNKEGLVEDVKVGGRLGCSDHEVLELRILGGGSRAIGRIKTLDLRRTDFALFKELLEGIPWARALEGRGVQEC